MEFNKFMKGVTNHMESKIEATQKRVKSELRRKTDDEVRSVIRNGNSYAREVAMEEADRRGISY